MTRNTILLAAVVCSLAVGSALVADPTKQEEAFQNPGQPGGALSGLKVEPGNSGALGGLSTLKVTPPARPELVLQKGHGNSLASVAFSPDGARVLTASSDKTVIVWDARTGRMLFSLEGHTERVSAAAFSPDGKFVATCGWDDRAFLWNAHTGEKVRTLWGDKIRFSDYSRGLNALAFSPDGDHVAFGSRENMAVLVSVSDGEVAKVFHYPRVEGDRLGVWVFGVAFSPDGKYLLTGGMDHKATLWSVKTGERLRSFEGHKEWVEAVAFSRDGSQVVTGSRDGTAILWTADDGKKIRTFEPDLDKLPSRGKDGKYLWNVKSVALDREGKRLLTGAIDRPAILWDATTGKKLRTFEGHAEGVTSVAFSGDEKRILSGSIEGTAMLWDTSTGQQLLTLRGHDSSVAELAVSPDGRRMAVASGWNRVTLWDIATAQPLRSFAGHTAPVWAVAFSPDGRRVATGSRDFTVRVWDASTSEEMLKVELPKLKSPDDRFSPPGAPPKPPYGSVNSLAFSRDGTKLLAGCQDNTAILWDAKTGERLRTFTGHEELVACVAFSRDGKRVATGSKDRTARVWDVETGKELFRVKGGTWTVTSVDFGPNDAELVTCAYFGEVRVWDAKTGEAKASIGPGLGSGEDWRAALSPDGKNVLVGGSGGVATLRGSAGGELATFKGHAAGVSCVSFTADGKRVLTGSPDGTVRLWDAATGTEVCKWIDTPDGSLVATRDGYYTASRRTLPTVSFRIGGRAFPFDQFDLKFNRPDIVVQRIGLAPKELVDGYHLAYLKRLKKMGFTEDRLSDGSHVPSLALAAVPPLATAERTLKLKLKAGDSRYALDRVIVSVNGVPARGAAGFSLRDRKAKAWEGEVEVELSSGQNEFRVSVLNENGDESEREAFQVNCTAPAQAPKVYALVVGVSDYADKRFRLEYAAKDAKDVAELLEKDAAKLGAAEVVRLTDKDATREKVLQARKVLEKAGVDDLVVVFFAGHGMLDKELDYYYATADIDFADPAKRGLGYSDIEGLLDGLKCRRKLLLMDTCHSGEVDKDELNAGAVEVKVGGGMVKSRGFEVRQSRRGSSQVLGQYFAELGPTSGAVVIAASGGLQHAFESAEWSNGVFTYALLSGLKSGAVARDKDGVVRVSKLRDHVLGEVRRLTGGRQVPTVRAEKLDTGLGFDFPLNHPENKK